MLVSFQNAPQFIQVSIKMEFQTGSYAWAFSLAANLRKGPPLITRQPSKVKLTAKRFYSLVLL